MSFLIKIPNIGDIVRVDPCHHLPIFPQQQKLRAPRHCQLRTLRKDFASAMLEDLQRAAEGSRVPKVGILALIRRYKQVSFK